MFSSHKNCQSCGIPWDKDPKGGGTNADGSKSDLYCGFCYNEGAFVQPDWTVADMQNYVLKVLAKRGIPEMIGKLLTKEIPKLERWKNK